jgi:hypothetical protein
MLAVLLMTPEALAQANVEQLVPDGQAADCRAAPADQPTGEEAPLPDESRLADCGPVLKPPASADGEISVPPVQGGETPVIPPSQIPQDGGEENEGDAE